MNSMASLNSVAIRPYAEETDFAGLVAFVAMQLEHERERQHEGRRHGGRVAPNYAQSLILTVSQREGCLLMAETGGTPVGFLAAYRMSDPDPVLEDSARDHGYVRDLFVLPNWRRMSVATRLIEAAEGHFRSIGVLRLRIAGPARNEAMLALCKSTHFKPYTSVYERGIVMPLQATGIATGA